MPNYRKFPKGDSGPGDIAIRVLYGAGASLAEAESEAVYEIRCGCLEGALPEDYRESPERANAKYGRACLFQGFRDCPDEETEKQKVDPRV